MKIEVYEDVGGECRWRAIARNGRIVADGAEGYSRRSKARRAVTKFLDACQGTVQIVEVEDAE
jgi:uncharacterized protein YegP (UPF0339 family)